MHTFDPSIQEAEAASWIQGQPSLHSEFQDSYIVRLSQKKKKAWELTKLLEGIAAPALTIYRLS